MIDESHKPEIEQLRLFHLLDLMSARHLNYLREKALLLKYAAGDILFSPPRSGSMGYYLVSGKVEIKIGDIYRVIKAGSSASYCSLEDKLPEDAIATALDDSCVLQLSRVLVEQYFSWSTTGEYRVVSIDDLGQHVEQQREWLSPLINSTLAKNLSKKEVKALTSFIRNRRVIGREILLHQGEKSAAFFILKSGTAKAVHVCGDEKTLCAGDFFGDESIVPDAPSAIHVEMQSDGVVAEIEKHAFNSVVKKSLVMTVSPNQLNHLSGIGWCVLDVRFPAEYKISHYKHSMNIPVGTLSKKMHTLDERLVYFLSPESGARGELACYILQKAGYRAFVLDTSSTRVLKAMGG